MIGGCSHNLAATGIRFPWFTLTVTSKNYANEAHIDPNDDTKGIIIWHEKAPPTAIKGYDSNIKNWYFLFPDMEIFVNGTWQKGVAIPLRHGTIVSWDARVLRHCTAIPEIINDETAAFGTFFGIQKKVGTKLEVKHSEKNQRKKSDIYNI